MSQARARIAIIGGGPGGYEAALVAAQLGAEVTVIEQTGLGGCCVLAARPAQQACRLRQDMAAVAARGPRRTLVRTPYG